MRGQSHSDAKTGTQSAMELEGQTAYSLAVSEHRRAALGFVIALGFGAGGGYALGPFAAGLVEAHTELQTAAESSPPQLRIERVEGTARILTTSGRWRIARVGEPLMRPSGLAADGPSEIAVSLAGTRVIAAHDARVLLSAPGAPLRAQLDSGRIRVHAAQGDFSTSIPSSMATVTGSSYGVWALPDRTVVAALDGAVRIALNDAAPKEVAKGSEALVKDGRIQVEALPPQLVLELEAPSSRGKKVVGRTSPFARVLLRKGSMYEFVAVNDDGSFGAAMEKKELEEGDIAALDAAGRRAEPGKPSQTLAELLADGADATPVAESVPAPAAVPVAEPVPTPVAVPVATPVAAPIPTPAAAPTAAPASAPNSPSAIAPATAPSLPAASSVPKAKKTKTERRSAAKRTPSEASDKRPDEPPASLTIELPKFPPPGRGEGEGEKKAPEKGGTSDGDAKDGDSKEDDIKLDWE